MADGRMLTREQRATKRSDKRDSWWTRDIAALLDHADAADEVIAAGVERERELRAALTGYMASLDKRIAAIASLRDALRECMEHLDADHPDDRAVMQRAQAALDASGG